MYNIITKGYDEEITSNFKVFFNNYKGVKRGQ